MTPAAQQPQHQLAPAHASLRIFSMMTGLPTAYFERLIRTGTWSRDKEFSLTADGEVVIDVSAFEQWVCGPTQVAPPECLTERQSRRTALYRHFGSDGSLLYVGISLSPMARFGEHLSDSHWSTSIASVTIEWFPNRKVALHAESAAIKAERPLHNILGATWKTRRDQ